MKLNMYAFIASALILASGCKKNLSPSSVNLPGSAKASITGLPSYQLLTGGSRVIAYDTGTSMSCLLGYDLVTNTVTLIQNNSNTFSALWTTTGLHYDGTVLNLTPASSPQNNFNEIGGTHIIAVDYNGTGHQDHLLVYNPGLGTARLLAYAGNGNFTTVLNFPSGIGGYNLASVNDKIIAYDFGNGYYQSLVCYRPGNGICWVLKKQAGGGYASVYQSGSGIGGYDLQGINDQIVALDYNPGAMQLVCYRPGLGYLWILAHSANATSWTTSFSSRSGFTGLFNLGATQDRLIAYDEARAGRPNRLFCYRPGVNGYAAIVFPSGTSWTYDIPGGSFFSYPMNANPNTGPLYYGDKMLAFGATTYINLGYSNILCYQSGNGLADIFAEQGVVINNFVQVY